MNIAESAFHCTLKIDLDDPICYNFLSAGQEHSAALIDYEIAVTGRWR